MNRYQSSLTPLIFRISIESDPFDLGDGLVEEFFDHRGKMRIVYEEGIVAVYLIDFDIVDLGAGSTHNVSYFLLLAVWEQDIGSHPDNQGPLKPELCHAVTDRIAMLGNIEPVHRPRQVKIAIRVEAVDKLLCVVLEIVFNFKFVLETPAGHFIRWQSSPIELGIPFVGGPVGHQSEFARQRHAGQWPLVIGISTLVPGGVTANNFSLQ